MRIISIYEQIQAVKTGFPQIWGPTGIFGGNWDYKKVIIDYLRFNPYVKWLICPFNFCFHSLDSLIEKYSLIIHESFRKKFNYHAVLD